MITLTRWTGHTAAIALAILLAVIAASIMALGGCSTSTPDAAYYSPAAYGTGGDCFYVYSPAEVTALKAAGLCPSSWAAAPMPLYWHEEYDGFYDSTAYYDVYVPATSRTIYVQRERSFSVRYRSAITVASSKAVYRSSSGGTISGAKLGSKISYGSSSSSSSSRTITTSRTTTSRTSGRTVYGGGSGRTRSLGGGSGRSH